MNIELREIEYGSPEYELEIRLRTRILREPLGLIFDPADLALERNDIHLGAFIEHELVGCLLLTRKSEKVMRMRQVAVDTTRQGLGIGKKLVLASELKCEQLGYSAIELNARDTAVPFYLSMDYEIYGEPFEEVTIPHRRMRKLLND